LVVPEEAWLFIGRGPWLRDAFSPEDGHPHLAKRVRIRFSEEYPTLFWGTCNQEGEMGIRYEKE
jgi:hypothetical protein